MKKKFEKKKRKNLGLSPFASGMGCGLPPVNGAALSVCEPTWQDEEKKKVFLTGHLLVITINPQNYSCKRLEQPITVPGTRILVSLIEIPRPTIDGECEEPDAIVCQEG